MAKRRCDFVDTLQAYCHIMFHVAIKMNGICIYAKSRNMPPFLVAEIKLKCCKERKIITNRAAKWEGENGGKWLGATREIVAVQIERKHGTNTLTHTHTHIHTLTGRCWQRIMRNFAKKKKKCSRKLKKEIQAAGQKKSAQGNESGERGTGAAGSLTTSCKRIKSKNSLKLCWPCIKCNSMQAARLVPSLPVDPAAGLLYPSSCLRLLGHLMRPLFGVKYSFGQWRNGEMPKNGQVFLAIGAAKCPYGEELEQKRASSWERFSLNTHRDFRVNK